MNAPVRRTLFNDKNPVLQHLTMSHKKVLQVAYIYLPFLFLSVSVMFFISFLTALLTTPGNKPCMVLPNDPEEVKWNFFFFFSAALMIIFAAFCTAG